MSLNQYAWRYKISFQGGLRKWDWHASDVEPDGRILMPAKFLHPDDGHVADANGEVDITALAGSVVRMRKLGVLRLLHVHWAAYEWFSEVHGIPTTDEGGTQYYHFDPATRMSDIYDRWEEDLGEPSSMAEFDLARRFFRYANPPADRLPPRAVLRAAAAALPPNPRASALRQFVRVRSDQERQLLQAIAEEQKDGARRAQNTLGGPVTEEEMVERVPFLKGLPLSCFDDDEPEGSDRFVGPDATSRQRLGVITVGFVPAAFFAYSKSPFIRHPDMLPRYLRSYHRFVTEAVAENPAFDISSVADLDHAFEHVAFGELLAVRGSPGWRDRMVHDAASVMRHARKTMLAFDPTGKKGVACQAPAQQSDREAFLKRVKIEYEAHRAAYGSTRKAVADRVKNAYERTLDAAAYRIRQIKLDGEAGRSAVDFLLGDGADLPYWDVAAESAELSERGHPTGRMQIRRYRWWRTADAWLSLERDRHWLDEPAPDVWRETRGDGDAARVKIRKGPRTPDPAESPPFHGSQFVCEFLGSILSDEPDTQSEMPLLAMLARHHALVDGGFLDVGQREMKEHLRRRWRLPQNAGQVSGLLQFDGHRAKLARHACKSSRSHRRVFVPHEEAEHALRLTAHGVDAIAQTWCRSSEFLQQVEYADRWEDPAGTESFGWTASRKLNRRDPIGVEHFFECDENHYLESVELLDLTVRRCNLEEPDIVPPPKQVAWKLGPGPYVFAFNGRAVGADELRVYLKFLLANVVDARFHDLRAGATNRSRRKGAPKIVLGEGLGHRADGLIERYSSLTEEQLEEEANEVRDAKIDRQEAERHGREK